MNALFRSRIALLPALVAALLSSRRGLADPAFPLKVSENRRYLADAKGVPFFVMGDTPWFLQKLPLEEVRRVMDDRKAKGFNTLFLELLDDDHMPSRDAHGNTAFMPETDITHPVEAYWKYADQVMDEAAKRGFFVIQNSIWYGAGEGLWVHHVTPENCRIFGEFLAKRYARFTNLMWMHVGDRNPDERGAAAARELALAIKRFAPHQLQTAHLQHEYASATRFHGAEWLDVNMAYTYGASYLHVLPEYQRSGPVRPVILGETGYEDEPNAIELLPDARKGDLWTPYRIRRNAWWAVLSGAGGYCAGTRLWRWESNWRDVLQARSTRQAPIMLRVLEKRPWWKLVPDPAHETVVSGFGHWKGADYVTAGRSGDGDLAAAYLPGPGTIRVAMSRLSGPVFARWIDPANGAETLVSGSPFANSGERDFAPPGRNVDGDNDWILLLETKEQQ